MSDVLMHSGAAAGTPPCTWLPAEYRAAVEAHLTAFLNAKERSAAAGGPVPQDVPALLREFIGAGGGGKRIRPLLCIAAGRPAAEQDCRTRWCPQRRRWRCSTRSR